LEGYASRPFSLSQRVLTEFRVMMRYLFQIIYPIPQQFSVVHAMALSTSLSTPWTTLPAILGVGLLLGGAVACLQRFRLLAFAILFFFLGHTVESTILPLELVFEHRNYLPTLFLFLPLAAGLVALMDFYRQRSTVIFIILAAFVPLLVTGIGFATYTRNFDWATEKSLWQDAVSKAPTMARPYQALALVYENENQLDKAYELYERALVLNDPEPEQSRFNSLGNMGNIKKKQGDYDQAVRLLRKALEYEKGPYAHRVRYNLALCLLNLGEENQALEHIEVLLDKYNKNYLYLHTKGFILFLQNDPNAALPHLRMSLQRNALDMNTLLSMGMALSAAGHYKHGAWFLKRAGERSPRNLIVHLGKLQNAIMMQNSPRTKKYLYRIGSLFTLQEIQRFFDLYAQGHHFIDGTLVLIDDCLILPPIVDYFQDKAERWDLDLGGPA
jgi:tetratricopeptide (TPR) repeat protein